MQGIVELARDHARDLTGSGDRVVVDLPDRHQLGGGPGQEDLVGQVELGAADVALGDGVAEVLRDLDDRAAVDAVEDRGACAAGSGSAPRGPRRCSRRSPRRPSPLVEQDRLLVAGVVRFGLGEDRVQVLPRGLGMRDQPVRGDPAPRRDLRLDARALALLAEIGAPRPGRDRRPRPATRRTGPSRRSRGRRSDGCSRRRARCDGSARSWPRAAPRRRTASPGSRAPPT